MDPLVTMPAVGLDAFTEDDAVAQWSRSAQMLLIARQLQASADLPESRAEIAPSRSETAVDADLIGTPRVRGLDSPSASGSFASGSFAVDAMNGPDAPAHDLWTSLSTSGDPHTAVALIASQRNSPSTIVRISAACSLIAIGRGSTADLDALTSTPVSEGSTATSMVSLMLDRTAVPTVPTSPAAGTPVSIGIAGTFGRWRSPELTPGGALFDLLKSDVSPDLYADPQSYYRWTGAYSEVARQEAAADLVRWLGTSGLAGPLDAVYAHSHGGNVALDAVIRGVNATFVLLIDTPAERRPPADWARINAGVGRAVSLRTRLDLVILLDELLHGGPGSPGSDGLTFPDSFDCRVLAPPVWFSHDAFLSPANWQKYDLVEQIRYEYSLA